MDKNTKTDNETAPDRKHEQAGIFVSVVKTFKRRFLKIVRMVDRKQNGWATKLQPHNAQFYYIFNYYSLICTGMIFTVPVTQSAVMPQYVVCPSVSLPVIT